MKILAIETSCDDTCVAVTDDSEVLSNIVSSQVELHRKYGGVYPFLAKREHQKNLPIVLKKALKKAKDPKIDLIAVTVGPGLEPCLWTGVNFAKELAKKWNLPIIPVNHIEAHIIANFIKKNPENVFPAIALVVSGGHTQLILMKNLGKYKILGETRDDAAGECFDKVARILGLGYPGGPAVAKEAARFSEKQSLVTLPRPMIHQKNYDFSFSGLKTAVLYKVRGEKNINLRATAKEIQQAIIDVLIHKTVKATRDFRAKTVILGGGVAANTELRKQLKKTCLASGFAYLVPPKKLCTDNAVMVAGAAFLHRKDKTSLEKIEAEANLRLQQALA